MHIEKHANRANGKDKAQQQPSAASAALDLSDSGSDIEDVG